MAGTIDGGTTWEKLERATPEHLVSIQFNAFDDNKYFNTNVATTEASYFEEGTEYALPFGNGIATGAIMYVPPSYRTAIGRVACPPHPTALGDTWHAPSSSPFPW